MRGAVNFALCNGNTSTSSGRRCTSLAKSRTPPPAPCNDRRRPTQSVVSRSTLTLDSLSELAASRSGFGANRFVFSHESSGTTPWRPDYATLAFARLAAQLGIAKIRLHDLRHFAATTMLLNGIDVRTAAGRPGHARASTTLDIYAHYTQPADQRASSTLAGSLDIRR